MIPRASRLRELIGGRWAVSLQLYLVFAPLAVLSHLQFTRGGDGMAVLAASLVGYLAMGGVLWLSDLTILRRRRIAPVSVAVVVGVGAVAGFVRALVAWACAQMWGLPVLGTDLVVSRLVSGTLLGAVLIPVGAYLLAIVGAYRTDRDRLVRERWLLHLDADRFKDRAELIDQVLSTPDTEALSQAADSLDDLVQSTAGEPEEVRRRILIGEVREIASQVVRPMSHALIAQPRDAGTPGIRWRTILATSLRRNPLPIAPVLVLWSISTWPGDWARWGFVSSLVQLTIVSLTIAFTFAWGTWVVRRHPHTRYVVFIAVQIACLAIGALSLMAMHPDVAPASLAGGIASAALWLPILTLAASVTTTAIQEADVVVADLAREVDAADLEAQMWRERSRESRHALAMHLHGRIQPRLLASAIAMESGGVDLSRHLSGVIDDLRAPLEGMANVVRTVEWREGLALIRERWQGLVDVQMGHICELGDDSLTRGLLDVVDEAVANAWRHGGARRVLVTCSRDGRDVRLAVRDDGSGPGTVVPGLGVGLFTAVAGSRWALESRQQGGVELTLTAPTREWG